ncbi:MAG: hypothetical protein Kapaf2KO_11570 [Candidatus Kapaibacteriales bacterium]
MKKSFSAEDQKEIYSILTSVSAESFINEVELLKHSIDLVVDSPIMGISAGRLWKLNADKKRYELAYNSGADSNLRPGYSISILDSDANSSLLELSKKNSIIRQETDSGLLKDGVNHYSLSGLGEMVTIGGKKYFPYAVGLNADDFDDSFYNTISIISKIVGVSLRHINDEKKLIKSGKDLRQAAEIQTNLFPDHQKHYLDYDIYGLCIPDSEVGGDYFDYITDTDIYGDDHLGLVVSDAASKGLPAAVQSLFVSGALKMGLANSNRISHTFSRMNSLIHQTFPYERFVTMVYLELTASANRLVLYANAGHCPPIRYKSKLDELKYLEASGGLLGVVPEQKYEVGNTRMAIGDVMALYTDGISEAMNGKGEVYGMERLGEMLRNNHKLTSKEISQKIIDDVMRFSKNGNYKDDMTLIIVKRKES